MIRVALPGLVGVALLTSCLSPTQVTVELSTDVPCSSNPVTTIAVGAPGQAEIRAPQTTTTQCTGKGQIGSIVVTPASDNGATFEIQVVVGVGAGNPPSCDKNSKCITARREIAFVPHTPLTLPIELDQACLGYTCPPNDTCVAENGVPVCKSAHTTTGCGAKETCETASSVGAGMAGSGMGGAGMGGAGMGGAGMGGMSTSMSSSSGTGGMGGHTCSEDSCTGCTGCARVTDDPAIAFRACPTTIAPPPSCSADPSVCCDTMPCPQMTGQPTYHCAKNFCAGSGFTCKQDQWDAQNPCPPPTSGAPDVPVKAGFLDLEVNTCVPNKCGACIGSGKVCIPVLLSCCSSGAPKLEFTCVKRDEPCCRTADCDSGEQCLHDASGTSDTQLTCTPCVGPGAGSP